MLSVTQIEAIINAELKDADGVGSWKENAAQKIHDLCKPAHDIHVSAAMLENEYTDTLVNMIIVTLLGTLIDQEGGGRTNFTMSPDTMAQAMKTWTYTVEHNNLGRTVRIAPAKPDEWEASENNDALDLRLAQATSTHYTPDELSPQAEPHEYNRPVWGVRYINSEGEPTVMRGHDRADAERILRSFKPEVQMTARVENRWCLHPECPSSGCLQDASKRDDGDATLED